jgi:hypothetical protein
VSTGFYYLGISLFNVYPVSAGGRIFSDDSGMVTPRGSGKHDPLTGWVVGETSDDALIATEWIFAPNAPGSQVEPSVSTSAVPEPASL